ncbi:MAG: superoxide dismutase family protein [Planctomycetota bacterium]
MHRRSALRFVAATAAASALTACTHHGMQENALAHNKSHNGPHAETQPANPARGVVPITEASPLVATMRSVGDSGVAGTFRFEQAQGGVRVIGAVTGLTPNTKHGCHIHAFGDASDLEAAASAGVHFNPFNHDHALPPAEHRHAGAFPNLEADAEGNATLDFVDDTITLTTGVTSIMGRSVIIHEKEDIGAQPWGGAGGRIAVGVIGLANTDLRPASQ